LPFFITLVPEKKHL